MTKLRYVSSKEGDSPPIFFGSLSHMKLKKGRILVHLATCTNAAVIQKSNKLFCVAYSIWTEYSALTHTHKQFDLHWSAYETSCDKIM